MDFNIPDYLITIYSDPLFLVFPVATSLISVGAFLFWALPWTWIAWKDPEPLRQYKVQKKHIPVERWFWPSMGRITVNTAVMFVGVALAWPLLRLTAVHIGPLPPWYVMTGQIVFFLFFDDFLYYWMHKALHTKWLYKHIHSIHHRPVTPCAIAGNYFHVVEFLMTTTLVLIAPVLIGCHVVTLWIWIVIRQLVAAEEHSGYDIPWIPTHWVPLYHGPAYHDFHHSRFTGNYAGILSYLDPFFYGYARGYEKYLEARKSQKAE